jgi:hypothetical protein
MPVPGLSRGDQATEPLHGARPDPGHVLQLLDRPEGPPLLAARHDGARLLRADPGKLLEECGVRPIDVDRVQTPLHERHRGRIRRPLQRDGIRMRRAARHGTQKDPERDEHEDVALLARHDGRLRVFPAGRVPFRYRWRSELP